MFFPRLRRHAKWMFVFLAVALGGGFVLFGVGAGGTGVGDIFRGGGGTSGVPSISSAQKKTEENPKDVEAWRDLSTALQTDGQTDEAIDAQKQVVVLAPKDTDALRELAGLYLAQAAAKQQEAQLGPAPDRLPGRRAGLPRLRSSRPTGSRSSTTGSAPCSTRRARRRSRRSSIEAQAAIGRGGRGVQEDRRAAARATRTSSSSSPRPPSRRATSRRRSPPTRPSSKLAPDDPSASIVKQQLKQLKQSSGAVGIDSRQWRRLPPLACRRRLAAVPVAVVTAALFAAGCGSVGYSEGTGDRTKGKELFIQKCGSCHTLADAGTKGQIGPNLDDAFLESRRDGLGESTIVQVVRGQIAYPIIEDVDRGAGHAGRPRRGPGRRRRRELRRRASPASSLRDARRRRADLPQARAAGSGSHAGCGCTLRRPRPSPIDDRWRDRRDVGSACPSSRGSTTSPASSQRRVALGRGSRSRSRRRRTPRERILERLAAGSAVADLDRLARSTPAAPARRRRAASRRAATPAASRAPSSSGRSAGGLEQSRRGRRRERPPRPRPPCGRSPRAGAVPSSVSLATTRIRRVSSTAARLDGCRRRPAASRRLRSTDDDDERSATTKTTTPSQVAIHEASTIGAR